MDLYRRDLVRLAGFGSVLFASGLGYSAETSKDGKLPEGMRMSKESDNKAIVGRWFTDFWGKTYNPNIIDELAATEMLLKYSLHAPRRGREGIASIDLIVVPTISFRLLYGLLILRHSRRELLWLGVTAHPNAERVARPYSVTGRMRLNCGLFRLG